MPEVRPKMSWGVEEDAIMGILFGEEIKCLGSDGFEESDEVSRICMDVLYKVNISNFSNVLSKMENSQSKECSPIKQPRYANTENLVHANPPSLNDSLVNISGHVEVNNKNANDVLGSNRHHLQSLTTSSNTNAKRLKVSSSDSLQMKELVTTITKNGNKLLNYSPLQKSNSSMAPYSVTAHPMQQFSQSHNVSFNTSKIESPVLSKDTPCISMNAANQKEQLGSFNVFGDGIRRALPFQESDKIAGGSYFKPTDTSCNPHGRNEELGVVRQQSRNNSGNIGNFFMVNPAHEHPEVGQKMLLFHPKKISKLDATEENAKGLTSKVSDPNCIYLFPNSINHRKNDPPHLDRQVVITSREELFLEGTTKSLSHKKENEEPSKMFKEARYHSNGFSVGVGALQVVENSFSTRVNKRSDEALPSDTLNSKEVDETENAKLCESNGKKENHSYLIKKNDHSISEDGVVFLEPQHNKSLDEVLIPDPGSSQEAAEVGKTGLCKKRGRKQQHSVKINDGSFHGAGEKRETIVWKKRRQEQAA